MIENLLIELSRWVRRVTANDEKLSGATTEVKKL
jgi:hypothetical protein